MPLILCLFLFLSMCSYWHSPQRKALKALKKQDCHTSLQFFREIKQANQKLKIARQAPSLCLNTAVEVSLWFYHYLSLHELTNKKKLFFSKKAGDLAFEQVKDYEQALFFYSFLKQQATLEKDKNFYFFRIAFSYFERGKWSAALNTLKPLLKKDKVDTTLAFQKIHKQALFLKARILLMKEEYPKAQKVFQKIKQTYPLYFKNQEMFLYLSFIYEEQKDFPKALAELKSFQNTSAFLKAKIKTIQARQKNQPGASRGQTL